MSNGVAANSAARDATSAAGTKKNCASGSINFLISHGQATLSTFTFSRVIHFITLFLQLLVQSLKAFDALHQEFSVAHFCPRPAAQDPIDPNALRSLEFPVLQVRVMHHLSYFQYCLVLNPEPLHQRLERAIVPMMRKLNVRHVEWQRLRMFRRFSSKNKLRLWIDEPPDQPR